MRTHAHENSERFSRWTDLGIGQQAPPGSLAISACTFKPNQNLQFYSLAPSPTLLYYINYTHPLPTQTPQASSEPLSPCQQTDICAQLSNPTHLLPISQSVLLPWMMMLLVPSARVSYHVSSSRGV